MGNVGRTATYIGVAVVVGAIGVGVMVRVLVRGIGAIVTRTIVVALRANFVSCAMRGNPKLCLPGRWCRS